MHSRLFCFLRLLTCIQMKTDISKFTQTIFLASIFACLLFASGCGLIKDKNDVFMPALNPNAAPLPWKLPTDYALKLDFHPIHIAATQYGFVIAGYPHARHTLLLRGYDFGGKQQWEKACEGYVYGLSARENRIVMMVNEQPFDGDRCLLRFHDAKDGAVLNEVSLDNNPIYPYNKFLRLAPDGSIYLLRDGTFHRSILEKLYPNGEHHRDVEKPYILEKSELNDIAFGKDGTWYMVGATGKIKDTLIFAIADTSDRVTENYIYPNSPFSGGDVVTVADDGTVWVMGNQNRNPNLYCARMAADGKCLKITQSEIARKLSRAAAILKLSNGHLLMLARGIQGTSNNDPLHGYFTELDSAGTIVQEKFMDFGEMQEMNGAIAIDDHLCLVMYCKEDDDDAGWVRVLGF